MNGAVDDFLAHYGVKGMKWGVRKDRRAARRETKAQRYDQKAKVAQTKIDQVTRARSRGAVSQKVANKRVSELMKDRDRAEQDAQAKREGKLTSNQKKMLAGAAVAGALVASYAGYKMADAGEFSRLAQKGKSLLDGSDGRPTWKKNEMLSSDKWNADALQVLVADKVNPNFGELGTTSNCRRATFAYEMRRRGFDVKATRTLSATGQGSEGIFNATRGDQKRIGLSKISSLKRIVQETPDVVSGKGAPFTDILNQKGLGKNKIDSDDADRHNSIFRALASQPNGARGELAMDWKAGGGHSMAWEIVKGKPVIFDTQTGKRYDTPSDIFSPARNMKGVGFTRLDNVELDQDFLMRWMRDA